MTVIVKIHDDLTGISHPVDLGSLCIGIDFDAIEPCLCFIPRRDSRPIAGDRRISYGLHISGLCGVLILRLLCILFRFCLSRFRLLHFIRRCSFRPHRAYGRIDRDRKCDCQYYGDDPFRNVLHTLFLQMSNPLPLMPLDIKHIDPYYLYQKKAILTSPV